METSRLDFIAPDLVQKLQTLDARKQHAIKVSVCLFAMTLLTQVDHDLLAAVRNSLLNPESMPADLLNTLEDLSWQFDEKYLPLKLRDEYIHFFVQARALMALKQALAANDCDSLMDCIYETSHAADTQKADFMALVESLM